MSIAISHNMDNINAIAQTDLDRYFGLTNGTDASGSKTMTIGNNANEITYTYTRGGVVITGTINTASQSTTWSVSGVANNQNRQQAIAEGLKVNWNNGQPTNLTFT